MADAAPGDQKEALAALPGIAFGIVGRNKEIGVRDPHVTVYAASWHPVAGSAAWVTATGPAAHRQGIRPGSLQRIRACLDVIADPSEVVGREVDIFDPASFEVATDGLVLMEHCRRQPADAELWGGRTDHFGVGGQCDLTTVGPNGITQRTLKTWHEDVVGERICPKPHTITEKILAR